MKNARLRAVARLALTVVAALVGLGVAGCAAESADEYIAVPAPATTQISAPTIVLVSRAPVMAEPSAPSAQGAPEKAKTTRPASIADGTYTLRNVRSQRCLDVPRRSKEARTLLWQWDCNSTEAQAWTITRKGDDAFTVASTVSGKCLEVPGTATTTNINLWQNDCDGSTAQSWKLEIADDGTYVIRSIGSGECIDVPHGQALKGVGVQQFKCYGGEPQRWVLTPTSSGVVRNERVVSEAVSGRS
jgi:hypothetical protein